MERCREKTERMRKRETENVSRCFSTACSWLKVYLSGIPPLAIVLYSDVTMN